MDVRSDLDPKESLGTFKSLLISSAILSDREAEVYVTVITMGQATSADIHRRLEKSPFRNIAVQSIHKILERLQRRGFIKGTISSGKRKHSTFFRANAPEGPLEHHLNAAEKLKDSVNEVVALLEKKYEEHDCDDNDQSIWVYEPHATAFREGLKHLRGAKKTIAVHSNNYSWLVQPQGQGVKDTLKRKMKDGVEVRLLGLAPVDSIKSTLEEFNSVRRETAVPCIPYCLIDGQQLLIAFNEGLDTKLLATKNTYLLDRHSAQFSKTWDEAKRV